MSLPRNDGQSAPARGKVQGSDSCSKLKKTHPIVYGPQACPTSTAYSCCKLTMQKPHVLQWLALGGLHMLQVEQYLDRSGHHHRMQLRSDLWGVCLQGHMLGEEHR